jgi:hypothetical protein
MQLVPRETLYPTVTRCFETPPIVSKIMPGSVTQALEKLFIGARQSQVSMRFPKSGILK